MQPYFYFKKHKNVCFYIPQSTCTPSSQCAWPRHVPSTQITPRERRRHTCSSHPQFGQRVWQNEWLLLLLLHLSLQLSLNTCMWQREKTSIFGSHGPKYLTYIAFLHSFFFLKLHNWNKHNSLISQQHQLFMTVFLERTEITTGEKQHHSLQSGSVRQCAAKCPVRPTVDPAPAWAAEATHQTEPRVCHFHHSKARVCRS